MKPKLLTAAILSFGVIAGAAMLSEAAAMGNPARDTPGSTGTSGSASSGGEDNLGYLSSGPNWRRHTIEQRSGSHPIRSHRPVKAPSWWRALWD